MKKITKVLLTLCLVFSMFSVLSCTKNKNTEEYTITFETNGGSEVASITQTYNTSVSKPTNPTKTGYTFDNWYSDISLDTQYTFTTMPLNGITLYAKWNINQYTITFNSNGGTAVNSIEADYNSTVEKPSDPLKDGYTFAGWYSDSTLGTAYTFNTMPLNGITLYAKWTGVEYTMTFDSNFGSSVASITLPYNSAVTKPADPTRTGYTFDGWYTDLSQTTPYSFTTMPLNGITLYAKWTINQLRVTFNTNEGSSIDPIQVNYDSLVTKPTDPTKTGYTFDGWYTDSALETPYTFSTGLTSDLTLYAKWTINSSTISFNSNGGSSVSPITQNYGSTVTIPTNPTKEGYTFAGWYTDSELTTAYTFTTMPLDNITLIAKWTPVNYTITFNSNGGSEVSNLVAPYNSDINKPTDPTKEGYTFDGWCTDTTLLIEYTFTTMPLNGITLFARWTPKEYTITFDSKGGSEVASISKYYGLDVTKPTDPTKSGCSFVGWYSDSECTTPYTFTTMPLNGITLYAKWAISSNTIVLNTNGGTTLESITGTAGDTASAPTDPTKEGYTFAGWYSDSECTTPYTFTTIPEAGTEIYAKWTPINYTITFNSNGGDTVASIETGYNLSVTKPTDPTKTGNTFAGWYSDSELTTEFEFTATTTMPLNGITLYAKWNINQYTITFDSNEGSFVTAITQDYNSDVSKPTDPTKTGNTFAGWYSDSTLETAYSFTKMPLNGITLYAKWYINQYTITFDSNEGSSVTAITQDYNSDVSKPTDPTKTGNTFAGWYSDSTLETAYSFTKMPLNGITLYAKWSVNEYAITFNTNGGSNVETINANYGTIVTKPANPTKEGYTFAGWYSDSELTTAYTFTTMPLNGINLYAKWTINQYTITFDSNEGSSVTAIKQNYGTTVSAPSNPSKEGYTFIGWCTDSSLSIGYEFGTMPAENITIYAKWEVLSYSISFDTNGGTSIFPITQDYGTKVTKPTNPTKEGHSFAGWYSDISLTIAYTINTMPAEDITLYAKWTINQYTITFNSNGGSAVTAITQDYDSDITKPNDPTKTGYTFVEWYSDSTLNNSYEILTMPAESITLYAKWTINQYTITFDSNGGSEVNQIVEDYGTSLTKPTDPTLTGYTFNGWYSNVGLTTAYTFTTMPAGNTTLYAKWTINQYTITFNSNGGTTITAITQNYGTKVSDPTEPTQDGYTFVGWYSNSSLTTAYTFTTMPAENITLYAKWDAINYTITFETNGGSTISSITQAYNTIVATPNNPTRSGFTFVGWYSNSELTTEFEFTTTTKMPLNGITLYAKWQTGTSATLTTTQSGYAEGLFVKWDDTTASSATVEYKLSSASTYTTVDSELIRQIDSSTARVDIVGLKAGTYSVKVTSSGGTTKTLTNISVSQQDRSGYAFFNATEGIGAYNNDGTLKTNAVIVYVTDATKNTVTATLGGTTYTGLSSILQNQSKSSYPLVIRILGTIETAAWNEIIYNGGTTNSGGLINNTTTSLVAGSTYTEAEIIASGTNSLSDDLGNGITQLNGLTNKIVSDSYTLDSTSFSSYDSYFNMLDISSAKNVTVEGIGTDAMIYQFGFTWKSCSNIEVRNLTFDDYTEDACSFEGAEDSETISGFTTGRIWVHNNTFNEGNNKWDVCYEQDKHEGDGATDLKRLAYVTFSYNHYYKNHKTGLVGGSDSVKTSSITFHHNFYDQCNSRLPLGRQANMHMYNNYYYGSTGTNMSLRGNAYALIEACYFEGCSNPIEIKTTSSYIPAAKVFNTTFDSCTGTNQGTVVTNREATATNGNIYGQTFDTDSSIFYYDSTTKASNVLYMTSASQAKTDCTTYSGVLQNLDTIPQISYGYNLTVDENNGNDTYTVTVDALSTATLTDPVRAGFTFAGWYSDKTLTTSFTSSTVVTGNMTIYAAWEFSPAGTTTAMDSYITSLIDSTTSFVPAWNQEAFKGRWNYIDGVFLNALLSCYYEYAETDTDKANVYKDFIISYVNYYINADGNFIYYSSTTADGVVSNTSGYKSGELDSVCETQILFKLYELTSDERYMTAIEYVYTQLMAHGRLNDSTDTSVNFEHKAVYANQVWLDGMYMYGSFYAQYAKLKNSTTMFNDFKAHYQFIRENMRDSVTGLYYHGNDASTGTKAFWADSETGNSESFWLRSTGWLIVSLVDVIEYFPEGNNKAYLVSMLQEAIDAVMAYEDTDSHMFYQVINLGATSVLVPADKLSYLKNTAYAVDGTYSDTYIDNYLESSGSSMIAYVLMKGARLGYLDSSYYAKGAQVFEGVFTHSFVCTSDSKVLNDICITGGLGDSSGGTSQVRDGSAAYYLAEKVGSNDAKGTGPFIMAYVEFNQYTSLSTRTSSITFDSNGGSTCTGLTGAVASTISLPTPTNGTYTFGGWYTDTTLKTQFTFDTMPVCDTTLYAKWLLNPKTITFDSNGGSTCTSITTDPGEQVILPTPTKTDYVFDGWYSDTTLETEYTSATMPSESITLYAKWAVASATITYKDMQDNAYSGDNSSELVTTYKPGTAQTLVAGFSYDTQVFAGWYQTSDCSDTAITEIPSTATGNKTLYAKWVYSYSGLKNALYSVVASDFTDSPTISSDTFDNSTSSAGFYQAIQGSNGATSTTNNVTISSGVASLNDTTNDSTQFIIGLGGTRTGIIEGYFTFTLSNTGSKWTFLRFMNGSAEVFGLRTDDANTYIQYRLNGGTTTATEIVNSVANADGTYKLYFRLDTVNNKFTMYINDLVYIYNAAFSIAGLSSIVFATSNTGSRLISLNDVIVRNDTSVNISALSSDTSITQSVCGYIVAKSSTSVLVYDGTGYVLIYNNTTANAIDVGTKISVTGYIGSYNSELQFTAAATIEASSAELKTFTKTPLSVTNLDNFVSSYTSNAYDVGEYVEITGTLTINGSYYNVAVDGSTYILSLNSPSSSLVSSVTTGSTVTVRGYFLYKNSTYATIICDYIA